MERGPQACFAQTGSRFQGAILTATCGTAMQASGRQRKPGLDVVHWHQIGIHFPHQGGATTIHSGALIEKSALL